MSTTRVGGEVDALCTRCRMNLAHTILAMVGSKIARVRCNTCGGDHVYRGGGSSASTPRAAASARAAKEARAEKVVISFQDQLAGKDLSKAKSYSPKDTYKADEVINHPTFGLGIVTGVRPDKVEVAFKADSKTLVHGRAGGPPARPSFHPSSAASSASGQNPDAADDSDEAESSPAAEPS